MSFENFIREQKTSKLPAVAFLLLLLNLENGSSFLCCLLWVNSQQWGTLRWGGSEGECDVKCLASGGEDETLGDMPAFIPMAKTQQPDR